MQFEEKITINASASEIFSVYENVENWSDWDPDVKASSIDGNFETGSKGSIHPTKGPKSSVVFSQIVPNESFTVDSNLPLCSLRFEHELLVNDSNSTEAIHRVTFRGFLSPVFGRIIGSQIRKGMPHTLLGLKNKAENS